MSGHEGPRVTYEAIGVARTPYTRLEGMPLQPAAAGGEPGQIEVLPRYAEALRDLDGFSHVWVVSHLHESEPPAGPLVRPFLDTVDRGLFATRSPRHPNPIGISVVRLVAVVGGTLEVEGLDLLDGTPVLDLKPYVPLFDSVEAERTGWLAARADAVHTVRADGRFDRAARTRPVVADVMFTRPRALPHDATVGDVRRLFESSRIRLALLVRDGVCVGAVARDGIGEEARDGDGAAWLAAAPATIAADASLADAHRALAERADGRLVVVGPDGSLRGLLCHNHARTGFCNERSRCGRDPASETLRTHWRVVRTEGPADLREGTLVAPQGRTFGLGETLTLPPGDPPRWVVIAVEADPRDPATGTVTVEPLDLEHRA